MPGKRSPVWLERLLLLAGLICLAWWTTMTVHGWYFRSQQVSLFESLTGKAQSGSLPALPAPATPVVSRDTTHDPAGLVGILDVPRLGISTPVISGDDEQALDVAAGHLADTPLPWEPGNSAVAAHRDGLFRPLQGVRRGDLVRVRTTHGDFEYTVRGTRIVDPDDLSVLDKGPTDSVTLITCYPFGFIGHAPQRFIVRAERVNAPAASQTMPAASVNVAPVVPPAPKVRVTKTRPAKGVKASPRVTTRKALTGDTTKRASVSRQKRTGIEPTHRKVQKEEKPKKRKWYRLFF